MTETQTPPTSLSAAALMSINSGATWPERSAAIATLGCKLGALGPFRALVSVGDAHSLPRYMSGPSTEAVCAARILYLGVDGLPQHVDLRVGIVAV